MRKTRKRIAAIILILSLLVGLSAPASFAEDAQRVQILFDSAQTAADFWGAHNLLVQYNAGEKAMQFTTDGQDDPYVYLNVGSRAAVSADLYKYVVLTYRVPVTNSDTAGMTQFFWMPDNQSIDASRTTWVTTEKGYKYRSQILDLHAQSYWYGTIGCMRIDPFASGLNAWDTLLIASFTFCASLDDATAAAAQQTACANGVLQDVSEPSLASQSVDAAAYTEPFWQGSLVRNESVLPVYSASGTIEPIALMYDAERIVSVRNSALNTEYQPGRDYDVQNGRLVIRADGRIPVVSYGDLHSATKKSDAWWACRDGSYTFIDDSGLFHSCQLAVTYTHTDAWSGDVPAPKTNTLCGTASRLRNQQSLRIVFYGDSITVGANASGYLQTAPYCPNWADLAVQTLKTRCGTSAVTYVNTALGGMTSAWGVQNVTNNVVQYTPDLLVLGFGMNDLTCGVSAQDYGANIRAILNAVRSANAACECILLSPITPNPDIFGQLSDTQTAYLDTLRTIAAEYGGVALADLTTLHRTLLTRKSYADMTGNNVNHTNDFLTRAYAQTVTALLQGVETGSGTPVTGATDYRVWGDYVFGPTAETVLASNIGVNTAPTALGDVGTQCVNLFGWTACSKKIVRFGYRYGDEVTFVDGKYPTEQDVLNAGASVAGTAGETTRFMIPIPVKYGTDVTVCAVAELADGSILDLWTVVYSASAASLLRSSFDSVALDGRSLYSGGQAESWLAQNPIHYTVGTYSALSVAGWAYLSKTIQGFAYRIDGGAVVEGNFLENRPDVKQAIHETAEGFCVTADLSALCAGTHVVQALAVASDGTQIVVAAVSVSVVGEVGITQQDGAAAVVTTDGLSYTARGYASVIGGAAFRITAGFVIVPDAFQFAEPFNRMGFTYSSTKPLRMTVDYVQGGNDVSDVFYLEAGQSADFHALIAAYLDDGTASVIRSVRFDSCTGEAADVFVQNIVTERYTVYDEAIYYLENERFKVGVQLNWGGGISYIEDKTHDEEGLENLINNFDTGRLVQQSYYGTGETASYHPGVFNGSRWNYNPVQGGDMYQNASRLIDFVPGDECAYVKVQPQDWSLDGQITPSYMENLYTLHDDSIEVDNRFTDYSGYTHPVTSQEVPAFYTVSYLDRFTCYTGTRAWTGDTLTVRDDLQFWGDAQYANDCTFVLPDGDTESWCAWTSTHSDFGIGLYVPGVNRLFAGRYNYDGSKSPNAMSTNYVAPILFTALQSYVPLTYSYRIAAGSVAEIRDVFTQYSGVQPQQLTVTFETQGVCDPAAKTVEAGGVYGALPVPQRSGYLFLGWYTQPDGGVRVTADTTVTASEDHTLYAHWEAIVPTGIAICTLPDKTVYTEGETLDPTGLSLTVEKSDGTNETVTAGFVCDPVLLADAGDQKVTVTYGNFSTFFIVTVREPIPDENSPRLTLCGGTTRPGCEVDVRVELTNNPGLIAAMICLDFDRDVLELVRVRDGGLLGEDTMVTSKEFDYTPYTVSWADGAATQNYRQNGTLATFTFRVRASASPGTTAISLQCVRDSTVDLAGNRIRFAVTDGSVGIVQRIAGDVNADGKVDLRDAVAYSRFLVGGWNVTIDETCADVNADGSMDLKDVVQIRRFLAGGWDVVLV